MNLTRGAKVRIRRSRSAGSLVATYCFQRARVCCEEGRGLEAVEAMWSLLGSVGGHCLYRALRRARTSPLVVILEWPCVLAFHPHFWGGASRGVSKGPQIRA